MIRRIVDFALRQPLFVLLGLVIFIVSGLLAFRNLPVEAFPDVTDTQVVVISLYPGRAAEEVERQVTMPLEVALAGTPGTMRMFSHTQFGLSYLVVTFDDDVSPYFARQQVLERLRTADLPPDVVPGLVPLTSAVSEIFRYRLASDRHSVTDLRTFQDWIMERQLRTVPGVADVVSFGGLIKTYEVQPDLARMRDAKVSLAQLTDAVGAANRNAGGGYVDHGAQQFLIRGVGLLRSAADLENIVVVEQQGAPLLVRDLAKVSVGAVPRQGVAGQDDEDDIVFGIVMMRKGENATKVLAALKERLAEIDQSYLPPGVQIRPFYDRSWLIDRTLRTVFGNLVEGALLVCAVLYLFLGNLRAAAIVAGLIPLSLLGTFLGLTWVGIPANLLSLGAMDFGIIVDGAVIVIEHIFHRLSTLRSDVSEDERREAVLESTVAVGRPTLFSMVIIIAAHLPIFTLQRHEGRIFEPMAWSVTSALVASLALSLTLVPLLAFRLLRRNLPHAEPPIVRWSKRIYRPALEWALSHRPLVLLAAAAALLGSLGLATRLGSEFLPELNEGTVWINVSLAPGMSLREAQAEAGRIRQIARTTPEVRSIVSKLGRPEDGTDPKALNQLEFLVDLHPEEDWKRGLSKRQVLDEMEANLRQLPGVLPNFSQPIRDNVLESISQIQGQIVIKISGDDLQLLRSYGDTVVREALRVPGVSRAFIDREGLLPQYRIDIDRARAARLGLNIGTIQDTIETALAGTDASTIWEGERRFAVVVRLRDDDRAVARIRELLVATPHGAVVPLSELATFTSTTGALNISRENGRRVLSIGILIKNRDMGSVVTDLKARAAGALQLSPGYRVTWTGEFENQERAMKRLAWVVPLSIFVIFLLLFQAFKSLGNAMLIIANIPFSMIGGIVALYLTGIPLSVSAAIGFIALFGQAVLNGVVMLSYFGQLRAAGMPLAQAVVRGSVDRLRTVLMTALLASLGLLPMALSTAIGSETQKPLAVVVIGGLVSATLLTLLVLPTLYHWAHSRGRHRER